MAHFAAAVARGASGWIAEELDLGEVEDLDGLVDEMRAVSEDASPLLLLVEENDEWLGLVRVDDDGDPRVFLSDGRATETSTLAAILGEAAAVVDPPGDEDDADGELDDDDEEEAARAAGEPVGDADLLRDLGVPAARLLALCAEEGQLPGDIMSALCDTVGCLEALDALRVA